MPGLVPGIHVSPDRRQRGVDGRDKPGHDSVLVAKLIYNASAPEMISISSLVIIAWRVRL
jgi:hypothetical protein